MARNIEPILNAKLGELLIARHPRWTNENVHYECKDVLLNYPRRQIDVLVENPFGQPVAIEAEFTAGPQVGREAESRLGLKINSGKIIESAISVVYPQSLRVDSPQSLESATLKFATHHLKGDQPRRWPVKGRWLVGTVDDLADTVEAISLSRQLLDLGTVTLQNAIATATKELRSAVPKSVLENMAVELCQQDEEQTTRMAIAILTGAFVFHYAIEGHRIEGHRKIPMVNPANGGFTKDKVFRAWQAILEIDYAPIFEIAQKILRHIPAVPARPLLTTIAQAAEELAAIGTTTFHDLAGKAFQALIADRKFLATYYTRPESACLLAELAVDRLPVNWADANAIKRLRVADFACGTGALLSAAQRSIYRRHRRTGADDATIHSVAMERIFTGTDIMPAAAHLTASMLSSIHPEERYEDSDIHALPYGRDPRWGISIGALDLAVENEMLSLFGTGEKRLRGAIGASEDNVPHVRAVEDSYDLIIMNPPFVRPTGHEAKKRGIPVPSFAAFGTTGRDQKDMSKKLARMPRLFGHGNAGLASNFMDLAHVKLKEGGILAVVLPFTFATGEAWALARQRLNQHYSQITMVAITSSMAKDRSFSADTTLAECLVIATKKSNRRSSATSFFNVRSRPETSLEATVVAKDIIKGTGVIKGSILDAGPAAALHSSLVRTMENLKKNKLRILSYAKTFDLPMTPLGSIGDRGPYHMDISSNPPRGPFDLRSVGPDEIATYPILWGHDAERERKLIVQYDQCGDIRPECEDEADELWSSASRLHYNRDFGLSAQSIAACLTPDRCLGGRAWPSFKPYDPEHEIPLALWSNTTLGLLAFWWKGTLQQPGRASLPVTVLPELLVLDVRELSKRQLNLTKRIFSAFESQVFKPANEAYCDRARIALDRAMLVDVMGLPKEILEPLKTVRNQWCAEPTVHGGKKTRIGEDMLHPGIVSQDRELDDAFFAEIAVAWKSRRKSTRKKSRSRSSRRSDM